MDDAAKVLEVRGLQVNLRTAEGSVPLLEPIDFELKKGRVFGLVGESGSGKTVTCNACSICLIRAGWKCRAAST